MKVLVLGHSSIAQRRAIPALVDLKSIRAVDIASRHDLDLSTLPGQKLGQVYQGYRKGLDQSDADIVYVSLINSIHEEWVDACIDAGKHVIVDKPAFLNYTAAEKMVAKAKAKGVCLAEATVFADHPQIKTAKSLLAENGGLTRLFATFSIPPLPMESYRNHAELGGGAFLDLSPYAVATSRLFFDETPQTLHGQLLSRHPETGVDTAFSLIATYGGGKCYVAHFGFDTEYQNRITAFGPGLALSMERVFSTPPDMENIISGTRANQPFEMKVPAADSFEVFFDKVVKAVKTGEWAFFCDPLLEDAALAGRLWASFENKSDA